MIPDWLLEGPRGRRLCLEYLRGSAPPEVAAALVWAGCRRESPGSAVMLTSSRDGLIGEQPSVAPEQFAALADGDRSWRFFDPVMLSAALRMTVDTARYWQRPDGSDLLAADAALRPLLREVAQVILSAMPTWWTADAAEMQWMIRFADDAAVDVGVDVAAEIRAECRRRASLERHAANDPRQRMASLDDAASGLWWSHPRALWSTRAVDGLPVGLVLVEDSLGWQEARTDPFPVSGRVCEIHTPHDWVELVRTHPQSARWSLRGDWGRTTGSDLEWVLPDWVAIAAAYDAVHLTTPAYLRTAGRALDLGDGTFTVLAGWEPDATYWLHDVHTDERHSQHWNVDVSRADSEWMPSVFPRP